MSKMNQSGISLKDWDVAMYRGVTTGLSDAFVIDEATRNALVKVEPKSAAIIKPVIRGRDVRRYRANRSGLYLLHVPWHFHLHEDDTIKASSAVAERAFKRQFPKVYQHLLSHKKALSSRNQAETCVRYEWYALQRWAADYHHEFGKEKLFWMDLTKHGRFAYDAEGTFCVNTVFMMTGQSIKYLCAVLNSALITWFMGNTALNYGMGVTRWIGHTVEQIPIPKLNADRQ